MLRYGACPWGVEPDRAFEQFAKRAERLMPCTNAEIGADFSAVTPEVSSCCLISALERSMVFGSVHRRLACDTGG
jgi:hypothetical protein